MKKEVLRRDVVLTMLGAIIGIVGSHLLAFLVFQILIWTLLLFALTILVISAYTVWTIKKYSRTVSSEGFLRWQNTLLEKYYGHDCFTDILGERYPVYVYRAVNHVYPFCDLEDLSNLDCSELNFQYKSTKYYKQYKRVMQPSIFPLAWRKVKRPGMRGYMLKSLEFDAQTGLVTHFTAQVGTYAENVYTSHILEYENYILYRKYGKKDIRPVA